MHPETPASAPTPPALGPLLGPDAVTLVGGAADADRLGELLAWLVGPAAGSGRWWCSLEWTDRMAFEERAPVLPEDVLRLVWGRWFGPEGDLEAWRDGGNFRWRFVGPGKRRPDSKEGDADAFGPPPEGDPALRLRAHERTALLWPRDDPRVASAPAQALRLLSAQPAPARLRYVEYLDHGSAAAVRYLEVIGQANEGSQPPEA